MLEYGYRMKTGRLKCMYTFLGSVQKGSKCREEIAKINNFNNILHKSCHIPEDIKLSVCFYLFPYLPLTQDMTFSK